MRKILGWVEARDKIVGNSEEDIRLGNSQKDRVVGNSEENIRKVKSQ